ncbi:MAG TPA: hypothetical protein VN682_18260 [Terriglobales bacterium]|nr:hypothetical protein [Terriglobales bacterium]
MPEQADYTDTERNLLDALHRFIKEEASAKPDAPIKFRVADLLWLLTFFLCIWLGVYLLGQSFSSDEASKFVFDRVLPWFLNFGAIATVLKSPDSVLAFVRNSVYRWIIVPVLALFSFAATPVFKIAPMVTGEAVVYIDGEHEPGQFRVNFRQHEVELKSKTGSVPSRHFRITRRDLLHGLSLNPDWRLIYPVQLDVPDDDLHICFVPEKFQFDRLFIEDAQNSFQNINGKASEYYSHTAGGFDIVLPAGSYRVRGFRRGCGLTALVKIEVGDNAPAETHYLGPVRCNRGMEPTVLSCDNIFQQDEQP